MNSRISSLFKSVLLLLAVPVALTGCRDEEGNKKGFNLFSLQDDITFGAQVAAEIESDSETYPILDSATYSEAYEHLYRVRDTILNSGKVQYQEDFAWRCRIIGDDSTLNAFCTPGGYIYVYTGLIKYLEDEASFAGVLGHEIAHADERHSTEALSKQYGTEVLFAILLGEDQGTLAQIAKGMLGLRYSRANESESDRKSVDYLYPTGYDARGAAKFFEKLLGSGAGSGPEFLSTHPNPDNRVEAINEYWSTKGGKEGEDFVERYKQFKASLP
jgi:predicted Zn-dependent protease